MSDFRFRLLENGLDSIASALESLGGKARARAIKRAIRDLGTGAELLFKECLRRAHWTQIYRDPDKADRSAYDAGKIDDTATFEQCLRRLEKICSIAFDDKQRQVLNSLRRARNDIEHFEVNMPMQRAVAVASRAAIVLLDFVHEHLEASALEPAEAQLVEEIRRSLAPCERLVTERWKAIRKEIDAAVVPVVPCPLCTQEAALVEDGLDCRFCTLRVSDPATAADLYVTEVFGECYYRVFKHGGCWPVEQCPSCGRSSLLNRSRESSSAAFVCFSCSGEWSIRELKSCEKCDERCGAEADGFALCDNCRGWLAAS